MKARLAKLISVKTIVTLLLTMTFCYCVIFRENINSDFFTLYTMVVSFYFGTQATKKNDNGGE